MGSRDLIATAMERAGGLNKLARRMEVTANAVAQWRDGRAIPEFYRADALAKITGLSLEDVRQVLIDAHTKRSAARKPGAKADGSQIPFSKQTAAKARGFYPAGRQAAALA